MERIKIEEITPYLPYGLNIFDTESNRSHELIGIDNKKLILRLSRFPYRTFGCLSEIKPILRPLSDLQNKELDFWIEFSEKIDEMQNDYLIDAIVNKYSYTKNIHDSFKIWNVLILMHFDVFNLIERGLAIDINILKLGE